jgi:glycolate oxidase iron-sulfur subunit
LRAAGADLREPEEAEICCGSAGSYHLAFPATATLLGRRKRDALRATGAGIVVTANPGCWIQLRTHWPETGAPELIPLARFLAERLAD